MKPLRIIRNIFCALLFVLLAVVSVKLLIGNFGPPSSLVNAGLTP